MIKASLPFNLLRGLFGCIVCFGVRMRRNDFFKYFAAAAFVAYRCNDIAIYNGCRFDFGGVY